jgi:hypothetical protein
MLLDGPPQTRVRSVSEDLIVRMQELTHYVVDIRTTLADDFWTKFLSKRVPSWKDNTSDVKLHVCISLVSRAFTQFVNNQFVFGLPNKNPIQAAWWAWINLAGKFGLADLQDRMHKLPKHNKMSKDGSR